MVRRALVFGFASLALAARDPGCGGVDSTSAGVNAPCTRTGDCANGLTCESGVCTGPLNDGGSSAEGGIKDAAIDG